MIEALAYTVAASVTTVKSFTDWAPGFHSKGKKEENETSNKKKMERIKDFLATAV